MKLYTIDTGYFKLDGGAMFIVLWNKTNPADEKNLCLLGNEIIIIRRWNN